MPILGQTLRMPNAKVLFSAVFIAVTASMSLSGPAPAASTVDGDVVARSPGVDVVVLQTRRTVASFVPRAALETRQGLYILDFGGWVKGKGKLLLAKPEPGAARTMVFSGLDRPHGMAVGADGWIYVGEVTKIFRFDPANPQATKQTVVTLPARPGSWKHPLTQFAFSADGGLLVNHGSRTDNCAGEKGPICAEAEGTRSKVGAGVVLRGTFTKGKVSGPLTKYASGLRNSMGIAVHQSGTVVQAENSRDSIDQADPKLSDEALPHDELNVLTPNENYGWPYCFDAQRNAPEFRTYACTSKTVPPAVLLPAHSAPLGLSYWTRSGNSEVLVGALHGYRNTGHRLVTYNVDTKGVPFGSPKELVTWAGEDTAADEIPGPVGVSVAADGSLLVADDRRGMVLRVTSK